MRDLSKVQNLTYAPLFAATEVSFEVEYTFSLSLFHSS